jgi:Leucine-rich repeat (LRR) protein
MLDVHMTNANDEPVHFTTIEMTDLSSILVETLFLFRKVDKLIFSICYEDILDDANDGSAPIRCISKKTRQIKDICIMLNSLAITSLEAPICLDLKAVVKTEPGNEDNHCYVLNELNKLENFTLTDLKLDFDDSKLAGFPNGYLDATSFSSVVQVDNLQKLELVNLYVSKIKHDTFVLFKNLTHLQLKSLCLQNIQRNAFNGLAKLTHLDLTFNQLRRVEAETFSVLENLVELNLSNNHLTELQHGLCSALGKLEKLDVSSNQLYSVHFEGLNSLRYFRATNTPMANTSASKNKVIENIFRLQALKKVNDLEIIEINFDF